ncbi:hypothetical protein [Cystobacter ferrugineus]|uniref:Uncharacterized protein n=1 Tax=Cystobacter ferrugineus TaxID=83449 RepID=A0A1L9BAU4_9BACT|nr:hypothetical protein [Cystobacter ferrugineus]OJH39382.1 hypothetical protein BON30_17885 [Cystobacter ferrugineus]
MVFAFLSFRLQGQTMRVKRLSLGWMSLEEGAAQAGHAFGTGRREAGGRAAPGQCKAQEWWLERASRPAQLLLSVCDSPRGDAGDEPPVEVLDNLFTYTQEGDRRDVHWIRHRRLRLSPLRMASQDEQTVRRSTGSDERAEEETTWNFETRSGHAVRAPAACASGPASPEREVPYFLEARVDPAFLEGGWKQAGLGTKDGGCHLAGGVVTLGANAYKGPGDASLEAVLLQDDTLLLEVRDDVWTGPSDTWLNDDHVEVWLSPQPPLTISSCGKPTAAQKPVQWGIRLSDGRVFPGFGPPKQTLQVESAWAPDRRARLLKVKLPPDFEGITAVYSDSDTGKKQEKMIATSRVKFGRPETLNPLSPTSPDDARCAVKDGQLSLVPAPELQLPPGQAVLPPEP